MHSFCFKFGWGFHFMIKVFSDGASRGNPGKSGVGVVLYREGEELENYSGYIGVVTNNRAEYEAIKRGVEMVVKYEEDFCLFLDSELIIKQLKGEYRVKSRDLKPIYDEVRQILDSTEFFRGVFWVSRSENCRADELANKGIDSSNN